jgi:hypothetical protein
LNDLGDAQTWTGPEYGILWECFFHSRGREQAAWQERLEEVWRVIERDMGVRKIFTTSHDPEFEPEFYKDFLTRLGYEPLPEQSQWWSKAI